MTYRVEPGPQVMDSGHGWIVRGEQPLTEADYHITLRKTFQRYNDGSRLEGVPDFISAFLILPDPNVLVGKRDLAWATVAPFACYMWLGNA